MSDENGTANKVYTRIPVMFQKMDTYQDQDTRFIPVKIWLMHTNDNFNGSIFNKEVVKEAIPSLANTPILAFVEINSDGDIDFSDHRYTLERKDGEVIRKYLGNGIGVIPESNNARFEHRLCDDGVTREFLVADGLIWTKWDDPVDIFSRDIVKNNSMEIDEDFFEGYRDKDGFYNFTKFRFFGTCVLGIDYQPAMCNSTIEANFSIDKFRAEVQVRMEQFKLLMNQHQSDASKEDSDDINNNQKGGSEQLKVEQTKQETPTTFSSTYLQKREALSNACDPIIVKDSKGDVIATTYFYICDFDDKYVYVERYAWNSDGDNESDYGRFEYSFNESDKTATLVGEFEQMVIKWLTKEEEAKLEASRTTFEALRSEFEQYRKDYSTSNKEVQELTEFKRKRLEDEKQADAEILFSQFDETLADNEEYKKLKSTSKDFSLEDIENQCLILFAKESMKLKSYSVVSTKPKTKKIPHVEAEETVESPYGEIFND